MKIVMPCLIVILTLHIAGCDRSQTLKVSNAMDKNSDWNDAMRDDLRANLRSRILGEVRLAKSNHNEILELCREVFIEEDSPKTEHESLISFAEHELENAVKTHSIAQDEWPPQTDCDQLDRVEAKLRERGILLWQASPCCDTCTGGELPDRIDLVERRNPGFRDRIRGYAFFIDQNMADMLSDNIQISVYLGYGWLAPDDKSVARDEYEMKALSIAREVCNCLREHGFEPDWDGSFSRKIGVALKWQRRTLLQ